MEALKDEDSTLIILGDHFSLDVHSTIRLNGFLQKKGLLKSAAGKIFSYEVIAKGAGGSCYLYTHPKTKGHEKELAYLLRGLLETFSKEHDGCIERILSSEEASAMGADPSCLLMLEAKEGYYFQDGIGAPEVLSRDMMLRAREKGIPVPGMDGATHGYSPEKPDYTTVFAIRSSRKGDPSKGQNPGTAAENDGVSLKTTAPGVYDIPMSLIDEGPTMAYLLGGSLPEADGRVLTELFGE